MKYKEGDWVNYFISNDKILGKILSVEPDSTYKVSYEKGYYFIDDKNIISKVDVYEGELSSELYQYAGNDLEEYLVEHYDYSINDKRFESIFKKYEDKKIRLTIEEVIG